MVGTQPNPSGFAMPDSAWLRALAQGVNFTSKNGITAAAGGGKADATQLSSNVLLQQVDTVANANDSVLLPAAKAGTLVLLFNDGANALDAYGRDTDTINQSATAVAYALAAGAAAAFFCATDGQWAAVKTA